MRRRVAILVLLVGVITAGHYLTSLQFHHFHDIYFRLHYLPIILAGIWFGLRGGLLAGVSVTGLVVPHVVFQFGHTPLTGAQQYLEFVLYLVVGAVTGALADAERRIRERLAVAHARLEEAYARLRTSSEALLHAEEQVRHADRLAALGELSAGMAHEIRNPLGSIKGAAEIFRDSSDCSPRLREFAGILVKEADRLNGILEHFLEFARPAQAAPGRVRLAEAVADVFALMAARARASRVVLEDGVAPDLPAAAIPPEALRQVLVNLVLNAIEAMPGGGRVRIAAGVAADRIRLAVTDDGPGVAPAVRERIWNPFFTTKTGGTGLGLAICQRVLAGYRGGLHLEDATGGGASFVVELPAAPAEK